MARATIIHNPTAGDGRPSAGELRELVRAHGYEPEYFTTDVDLDALLQEPGDLVIVAGGDGTVGQVAARLIGREIPLAILPVGTANNLASSIGIVGAVDAVVAGWRDAARRSLNVAAAHGPWGARPFVESFGLGLFAHAMPVLSALKKGGDEPMPREAQIRHDRRALRQLVDQFVPRSVDLRIDGRSAAGDYLLVEIMNAPMLGPQLRVAPRADPGDGRLEVVLIREADRKDFGRWLEEDAASDPRLDTVTAETIEIMWDGDPIHIDGETWAEHDAAFRSVQVVAHSDAAPVRVAVEPGVVPVLVPGPGAGRAGAAPTV
jgi:diacylglycerol kinase (ATP)